MDKGGNSIVFLHEIKNCRVNWLCFLKIMTILTDSTISNSMSSFVPKYWLNWQILVALNFTKVYIYLSTPDSGDRQMTYFNNQSPH